MLGDVLLKKIRVAILVAASIAATATAFLIADALNPELTESTHRGVSDSEKGMGEGLKVVGNWTLTTSYNPESDLKWSNINSSLQANIPNLFDIDISMIHDLYKQKYDIELPRFGTKKIEFKPSLLLILLIPETVTLNQVDPPS